MLNMERVNMGDWHEQNTLNEAIKASVKESGVLSSLQQVTSSDAARPDNDDLDELKDRALSAADDIQQYLDSGKLDDGTAQKLNAMLSRLRSALAKDGVSRATLANVLSEALTVIGSADGTGKTTNVQQTAEQIWLQIEADNKDIDDDFTKMRKSGVRFNDTLWNRHKELMEQLQTHPRDITKQKELDAVDDAMLMQAEPQMDKYPDAKPAFDDAKKKSKERHQMVDKDLAAVSKDKEVLDTAFDDGKVAKDNHLTMNDVSSQSIGQKQKTTGKHHA